MDFIACLVCLEKEITILLRPDKVKGYFREKQIISKMLIIYDSSTNICQSKKYHLILAFNKTSSYELLARN